MFNVFFSAIKAGIGLYIFGAPSELHRKPFLTVADMAKFCRINLDISFGLLEKDCGHQIAEIRVNQRKLAQ